MVEINRYKFITIGSIISVIILALLGYQMYASFQWLSNKYMKVEARDLYRLILQRQKEEGYAFAMGWSWWDDMRKAVAENNITFISNEVESITSPQYWSSLIVIHNGKVIYKYGPLIPKNPAEFLEVAQDIPQRVHSTKIGKRVVGVMTFLLCNNEGEDPLPDSAILLSFDWEDLLRTHFAVSSFVNAHTYPSKPGKALASYPLCDIHGKAVGYLVMESNQTFVSEMHTHVSALLWLEIAVLTLLLTFILLYVKRHSEISATLLRAMGIKEKFTSLRTIARHVAETLFTNTVYRYALETALSTKSVEKTLQRIANTVAEALQSDQWSMVLISGGRTQWRVLSHSDTIKETDIQQIMKTLQQQPISIFDILKEKKECLFIEDVDRFPQWRKANIKGVEEIASNITIPMRAGDEVVAALCLDWFRRKSFTPHIRKLTYQAEKIINNILKSTYDIQDMFWLSYKDPLLGIDNRRIIGKLAERKLHGSILFMDIDNFKLINDRYGHSTGDMVLKRVSETISSMMRKEDVLFRYGGDEFIAYLEDIDTASAKEIAERVRKAVREELKDYNLDISIGITDVKENSDIIEVIKRADTSMYQEKQQKKGENRNEHRDNNR
ncbi:MAG: sensor domain-containing diguanylate cyclase [Synergistetes bacterium]|nr:sensor domain-containing diguanylate cyclase [Synergistota bacterium]